jgi:arylamine N-acetyltransferase
VTVTTTTAIDFDVAAYLHRIGLSGAWDGGRPPADLATLARIAAAHGQAIAYENLDKFTGRETHLDQASLITKIVRSRRGGGCYEQNLLLRGVLDAVGYTTTLLSGRVMWGRSADTPMPPRTHMLLRVELPNGPHIVDAGFGLRLTGVLALEPDTEQPTPHGLLRLRPDGSAFVLEALLGGRWMALYRFDLAECYMADFSMSNFYNTHHPDSMMVGGLLIGRADTDRRYALSGRRSTGLSLAVHHVDGPSERHALESPAAVRRALEDQFLIDLSGLPDLDRALTKLF